MKPTGRFNAGRFGVVAKGLHGRAGDIVWLAWVCGVLMAGPPTGKAAAATAQEQRRTPVVTVFRQAKDAVVNISSTHIVEVRSPVGIDRFFEDIFDLPQRTRKLKRTSVGSGFVLHPAGYIVTNAHVVARSAQQKVIFADQREFDADVVAVDHERDLAVLKIDPQGPLAPLPLGRSDDLMVGETAIAIGNPLGYQHTVTAGVVSALDRTLELGGEMSFSGLIQTDASINPGNSGGPLLNILGQLIGINTAIRGDAQNIGFAIPVDQLRELLPELLDVERRYGFFSGVRVGGSEPCRVEQVVEGSPAAAARVLVGDVVTHVDDQPIGSGIDFHIALIGKRSGDTVLLTLGRGGAEHRATLRLAQRPLPDGAELLWRLFGLQAQPLTPKMSRALGMRRLTGLMITRLEPGGPADRARLERGDILVYLGRHQTASVEEVGQLLEPLRGGAAVRVTVLRVSGRSIYRVSASLRARS